MKTKILIAACLTGQMLFAQTEIKKSLPGFNQIVVDLNTKIYLKKSDVPYVSMSDADSGFTADVTNGKLILQPGGLKHAVEKITVGYVNLNSITVNVPAVVKTDGVLTTTNLELNLNGAAKCKLDVSANIISCLANGAASAFLTGACTKLEAILTGAATLKAENLVTENANINTSGAATAKVNVSNKLEGNASGASTIKYAGNPKETQINQSGASSVKRIDVTISTDANGNTDVTTSKNDSTKRYNINGKYEIIVHERKSDDTTSPYKKFRNRSVHKKNWAGIDLFENGYLTPDNNITLASNHDYLSPDYGLKNLGCNLNLFEKDFRFANGKLQFVTGLGFSWNSFALKNKTVLNPDSSYTGYTNNSAASYTKNKLKESFITVPLLFELNTSRKDSRNFHIAFGVIGGAKLGSRTKQFYTIGGHEFHDVKKDDYNLFPFKLDATVRVGYGKFTMFATYSLTPLFEYGKGPELYPFTVGLRIIPF